MLHTVIFIGRSGCGKGTQAELFKNYVNESDTTSRRLLYVETGDHFRQFIQGANFSSKLSNEIYESDERQPDFLACWMWGKILIEELDQDMHLVFDGAPRSLPEAAILSTAMKFYKREQPIVVYINVSRKWAEEKLLTRGRSDDKTVSKIDKRLDWFDEDTLPAIEYFKTNNLYRIIEVNGEQPIEKVHTDIMTQYGHSS